MFVFPNELVRAFEFWSHLKISLRKTKERYYVNAKEKNFDSDLMS